jgi:hypothetical protein
MAKNNYSPNNNILCDAVRDGHLELVGLLLK